MNRKVLKILFAILLLFFTTNVEAEPANNTFLDDNLYKCIIDTYNKENSESKDYSYSILPEEFVLLKDLDCSKYSGEISNLTGLDKLIGLTSLNIDGNTFWGPKLTLNIGSSNDLNSNIKLPSQITITDINYSISNTKIATVKDGKVTGVSGGSTYVTMTGKVTGNVITEKYLIVVNGDSVVSDNGNLSSLSLSYGDIGFKSNIKKYSIMIPNNIKSIDISAEKEDKKASFVSGYGPRTVNLKVGTNTFYIKVKAEDGSINVYTIGIIRGDGTDDNNLLTDIQLSVGEISFSYDISIYSFSVAYDVKELDVMPITESLLSTYTVSDTNLSIGENKITITVIAENGNEKEYQLIVNREEYDSENNYLKSLEIDGYNIKFDKSVTEYDVTIKNEKELTITAMPEIISSGISVIGNKNIENGSKIIIRVVDSDNVSRDYVINITKGFLYNLSYKELIVVGELLLILLLLIIIIVSRKKRKRKKKNKYIDKNILKNKICKNCGTVNNPRSNTCYVCGKELK